MATVDNQQSWLPYDASIGKDCSQGFCSIYCPQWCYTLFSPPPPLSLAAADDDDPTAAFSPLVITVIAVLATALLLASYYTFVSKKCVSLFSTRRPIHSPAAPAAPLQERHASPANGLEEELINKIAVLRYKREDGRVDVTDCPVCLGEFRDEESLRLLPKCGHAFHLRCIDTWLMSHANCPLCRASIVVEEDGNDEEMVVIVEEDGEAVRRCLSGGSSIGDVVGMSIEEEYVVAKKCGLVGREGEQSVGNGRNRGLNCVMRTVRMKRSVSSGRFFFGRKGRGRNFLLPV